VARQETFAAARERLLREMPERYPQTGLSDGYEAVTWSRGGALKFPYLNFGRGYRGEPLHRVQFKAQAVHDESGLSLWVDIRGMSAPEFDAIIRRHFGG
jgi:hypothetical protein